MKSDPSVAMRVRFAREDELEHLAEIWHEGWLDAHAPILPPELARYRTLDSFTQRLHSALPNVRVLGPAGSPAGFCLVQGAELYQLYVAASGRRAGVGAALLGDAEARLSADGTRVAWLACAIGNERAAMFYQRHGWTRARTMVTPLETQAGPFPLKVWRFEKTVFPVSSGAAGFDGLS